MLREVGEIPTTLAGHLALAPALAAQSGIDVVPPSGHSGLARFSRSALPRIDAWLIMSPIGTTSSNIVDFAPRNKGAKSQAQLPQFAAQHQAHDLARISNERGVPCWQLGPSET